MSDRKGKGKRGIAIVTGASAGIGHAIAIKLAKAGYDLAVCARRESRLDELAAKIDNADGGMVLLKRSVDLRDEAAVVRFFTAVEAAAAAREQPVTLLVNNAGVGRNAPLRDGATELWKEMLEVNVLALCICTREALRFMDDTIGHIVHIGSMSGHRVAGKGGMYTATKHAVTALTESLRRELFAADSGIRVTQISPGFVETEFAFVLHDDDEEKAKKTYNRYKCLTADDVADACLYAVRTPPHVNIGDILMRPTEQKD